MNNFDIIKEYPNKFNLCEYYQNDLWNLENSEFFNADNDKKNIKNKLLDFTKCNNIYIREECKKHIYNGLYKKEISINTILTSYRGDLYTLFEYINLYHMDKYSITDINDLESDYIQFLEKNNKKVFTVVYRITKDMEKKQHKAKCNIYARALKFQDYMVDYYKNHNVSEFDKDIWDIRKTRFKYLIKDYNSIYKIDFTEISIENLKLATKAYIKNILNSKSLGTCRRYVLSIKHLNNFLVDNYNDVTSLKMLTRDIVEDFIIYIKNDLNLSANYSSSIIGNLNIFIETCKILNLDDKPEQSLFFKSDSNMKVKSMPSFYTNEEVKQIYDNIHKVSETIGRMFFVIEQTGIRVSELCTIESNCISYDTEGDAILTYYQQKTKKYNHIPINEILEKLILQEIDSNIQKYGLSKYVFTQDGKRPISPSTFSSVLNKLTYDNNIKNRAGDILRIKAHSFRGTFATNHINYGTNPNILRRLLGQSNLDNLKFYTEIHDETLLKDMLPIINKQDIMISNIGKVDYTIKDIIEDKNTIPLSNGSCGKPTLEGKCNHANACYSCNVFKPSKKYLSLYKYQLDIVRNNIVMAKLNGYERLLQINRTLEKDLINIIESVDDSNGQ